MKEKYQYKVKSSIFCGKPSENFDEFSNELSREQKDGYEFVCVLTRDGDYFTYLLRKKIN